MANDRKRIVTSCQVTSNALSCLPQLLTSVDDVGSARCQRDQLMTMAKQVNASLAALGGFEEVIKPGCDVEVRRGGGSVGGMLVGEGVDGGWVVGWVRGWMMGCVHMEWVKW